MSKPPKPAKSSVTVQVDGNPIEIPMWLLINVIADWRREEITEWLAKASDKDVIGLPLIERG